MRHKVGLISVNVTDLRCLRKLLFFCIATERDSRQRRRMAADHIAPVQWQSYFYTNNIVANNKSVLAVVRANKYVLILKGSHDRLFLKLSNSLLLCFIAFCSHLVYTMEYTTS